MTARLRVLLLVLVAVLFLLHAAYYFGWIIDDAFVSFRYAQSLAHGHGLAFNPGERVEGYTNFAWVLIAAASLKIGIDPSMSMPVVGAACGLLLILFAARAGRVLAEAAGKPHPFAGLVAATLLAATPDLAFYAVSGLETALFALLVTCGAAMLVEARPRLFAASTAAAFLVRPEAGLLAVIGAAAFAWRARRDATQRRGAIEAAAILTAVIAPYLIWKKIYFGALLPNTLAAKPPSIATGFVYIGHGLLPLAGVVIVALIAAWTSPKIHRPLLAIFAVFTLAVAIEGGDFMPVHRLLLPWFAVLFIAADRQILAFAARPKDRASAFGAAAVLAAAAYLPLRIGDAEQLKLKATVMGEADVPRVKAFRRMASKGVTSVGTYDVGLIGYVAPEITILDLGGLTDRTIARAPGNYATKEPPSDYVLSRAPEAFLFTTLAPPQVESGRVAIPPHYHPEQHVMDQPWFAEQYSFVGTFKINDGYYLHWFARKGAPRL